MKPLVSVAMTTYNGEKYLKKQLDSILNQTYPNMELIICDDGSSDSTTDIINEYLSKYPNIHFYRNEQNLGFTKNFEKAILLCSGEYIFLADQDDIWRPDKIETLLNSAGDKRVAFSKYSQIDENDNYIYKNPPFFEELNEKLKNCNYDYKKILIFNNFVTGCTMMIKKDFVKNIIPIPKEVYHDWWIAFIAARQNELVYIEKPLINYRIHTNNETAGGRITDKNNKEYTRIQKLLSIVFDKNYLKKKNNNIKKILKFLNIILEQKFLSEDEKRHVADNVNMYKTILEPKINTELLKYLYYEFRNRKYISVKKGYFLFSIFTRILNFGEHNYE